MKNFKLVLHTHLPCWALTASTIWWNSGLSDAPPTKKPSMSGWAIKSAAFLAFADPPYKILTESRASAETFVPSHSLISACVS